MNKEYFLRIAYEFRSAIEKAKSENRFNMKDRMSRFPFGCCDDTCDLFAYYMLFKGIDSYQLCAKYDTGRFEDLTNHVWLVIEGYFVDLTYDQFHYNRKIYVGDDNSFFSSLLDRKRQENYDISNDDRLIRDYNIICEYLNNKLGE